MKHKTFGNSISLNNVFFIALIVLLSFIIVLLISRNYNLNGLLGAIGIISVNIVTLCILVYAAKISKERADKFFYVWLFFALALFFWIMGDTFWSFNYLFQSSLFNDGLVFIPYLARIFFIIIALSFISKPALNVFLINQRRIEILMLIIIAAMYLWAFILVPLLEINEIDFLSLVMLIFYQVLFFALLYLTLFAAFFYKSKSFKGTFNLIIFSSVFQLIGTVIYGYELIMNFYPGGGIEDVIWVSSSLLIALAAYSFIKMPDLNVINERKLKTKFNILGNSVSILAATAYAVVIWSYFYNNIHFGFIILCTGVLVALALFRQFLADKYIEQSQNLLKNSEKKFRAVYEYANDGIILINKNGDILSWNRGATEIFGYTQQEIVKIGVDEIIPPEYRHIISYLLDNELLNSDLVKNGKVSREVLENDDIKSEFLNDDPGDIDFNINEAFGIRKGGERFPLEYSVSHWYVDGDLYIAFFVRDITERREAEEKIRKSLEEKSVLLKEIHHRVKNNLHIVSSLLNIESRYIENKNDLKIIREGQDRVHAMALIHKKLYESDDLSNILFAEYIETLALEIIDSYGINDNIDLEVHIDDIPLNIDQIIPYGLIINELITNSIKYAFPDGNGKISIKLTSEGLNNVLTVSDNGIGLPEDLDINKTRSLGLRLVRILTRQLKGIMEVERTGGTTFKMKTPLIKDDE